jgi:DNA-binding NtrC family response regulator
MLKASDITVLLVDDEADILESLSINLQLDDFKLLTASSGMEAIEVLKKATIDFIISDVRMPKGDGVFLLNYVKEHYPHVPHILLYSGFAEITANEVKRLGGIDLISKPPNIDELASIIKKYCNCI